jgi:hypothetical protein
MRLHRLQVRQVLPFVITGTSGIKDATGQAWLEWRRLPQFKRFWRLDIVMPVYQIVMTPAVPVGPRLGNYHRMPLGRANARLKADISAVICQPLRTPQHIRPMGFLGRDARESNVLAQVIDEA